MVLEDLVKENLPRPKNGSSQEAVLLKLTRKKSDRSGHVMTSSTTVPLGGLITLLPSTCMKLNQQNKDDQSVFKPPAGLPLIVSMHF